MDLWKYYDGDLKYPNIINHSHEKEIAKTKSDWAFEYVSNYGEDKELEPIITTSAKYSFMYADEILNGPFPLGEPIIARMKLYTNAYTNEVLKKDFYLDGKLICKYEG